MRSLRQGAIEAAELTCFRSLRRGSNLSPTTSTPLLTDKVFLLRTACDAGAGHHRVNSGFHEPTLSTLAGLATTKSETSQVLAAAGSHGQVLEDLGIAQPPGSRRPLASVVR